ncbi:MAG: SBBP repeat-containing protein [candidate division WOR-3 bacterium]|nr:SBBP repeat-containing protein [candidate division WOR-3 bacterium]
MTGYRSSFVPRNFFVVAVVIVLLVACGVMETKWTREINVLGPGNYRVNSISSIKNEIYVMGTYWQDEKTSRCFITKYDTDGSLDWFSVFESPGVEQAAGIQIVASMTSAEQLDASSEVYGLIQTRDTNGHQGIVLVRYDTLGNTGWQNTVISSEGTLNATLLSDHVGNLYVAGWEKDVENKASVYVGKYSESGDAAWFTKYYNEQIDFGDLKYDMMQSNCLLLAGVLTSSEELFYMKYDGSGQFLGYTIHQGPRVSELSDVKIDPNGYVYLAASINRPETGDDYFTIVYDKNDNLLWTSHHDGAAHRNDKPKAIAVDESLNVYVAGTSENTQGMPVITIVKYDSAGSPVWTANLPQKNAAEPFMMQPRYIPMGRYDEARHLYIAGMVGEKALIARCNLQGVFSWTDEYGQIHRISKPTAMSGYILALQSIEDGKSGATIVKFGPSTVVGLARWD